MNAKLMATTGARLYCLSAVGIYFIAAVAKLTSRTETRGLGEPDPFLRVIDGGQLIIVGSIVEIFASVLIAYYGVRSIRASLSVILWMSTLLVMYRLGVALSPSDGGSVCKCFGGYGGLLPAGVADRVAIGLLAYLWIPPAAILGFTGKGGRGHESV